LAHWPIVPLFHPYGVETIQILISWDNLGGIISYCNQIFGKLVSQGDFGSSTECIFRNYYNVTITKYRQLLCIIVLLLRSTEYSVLYWYIIMEGMKGGEGGESGLVKFVKLPN
jgi:hypothetical protein